MKFFWKKGVKKVENTKLLVLEYWAKTKIFIKMCHTVEKKVEKIQKKFKKNSKKLPKSNQKVRNTGRKKMLDFYIKNHDKTNFKSAYSRAKRKI